jgi:hypothetical protein
MASSEVLVEARRWPLVPLVMIRTVWASRVTAEIGRAGRQVVTGGRRCDLNPTFHVEHGREVSTSMRTNA